MSKKSKNNASANNFFALDDDMLDEEPASSEIENFEKASNEEITDYQRSIREATANTRKSLENQWNTDYYFCAFFADQQQRDEFLQKAGALDLIKDNFINGAKLAELLGISITPQPIERPKLFAAKKDWLDITM